jgi:hypothetical protein
MVINRLTGIGDVWMCVDRREYAKAKRLGREFAEDLRLLAHLGWAEHIDRETVALNQPPDELTSVLERLHRGRFGVAGRLRVAAEGRGGARSTRPRRPPEPLGAILGRLAQTSDDGLEVTS